jgi:hypothetical protein
MVTRNIEPTGEQDRPSEQAAGDQELSREELRRRAAALSGRFRSGLPDLSTEHDRYLEDEMPQ